MHLGGFFAAPKPASTPTTSPAPAASLATLARWRASGWWGGRLHLAKDLKRELPPGRGLLFHGWLNFAGLDGRLDKDLVTSDDGGAGAAY